METPNPDPMYAPNFLQAIASAEPPLTLYAVQEELYIMTCCQLQRAAIATKAALRRDPEKTFLLTIIDQINRAFNRLSDPVSQERVLDSKPVKIHGQGDKWVAFTQYTDEVTEKLRADQALEKLRIGDATPLDREISRQTMKLERLLAQRSNFGHKVARDKRKGHPSLRLAFPKHFKARRELKSRRKPKVLGQVPKKTRRDHWKNYTPRPRAPKAQASPKPKAKEPDMDIILPYPAPSQANTQSKQAI